MLTSTAADGAPTNPGEHAYKAAHAVGRSSETYSIVMHGTNQLTSGMVGMPRLNRYAGNLASWLGFLSSRLLVAFCPAAGCAGTRRRARRRPRAQDCHGSGNVVIIQHAAILLPSRGDSMS
ncbi:hypothetical protein PGQ11_012965 [Apiospora arundinis]|uniref:Uncharacterized protein n=1 Tax=Apiospora arundinis TaxID=335852 RepID=A0ABR2I3V9_9PEZI